MRWYREHKYVDGTLYLKCTKCSTWKSSDDYNKWKWHIFWLRTECKSCLKERNRKRYESKREHIASQNKEYYWNNKEKTSERKREYYLKTNKQKRYADNLTEELWFSWYKFHHRTRDFVSKFWVLPKICSICWIQRNIEIHHPNHERFEDWSNVVFCCRSCHRQIHSWRIDCPTPIDLLKLTTNHELTR